MATIVTRSGKGSPLTNNEVDANFNNLNSDKAELSGATFTGVVTANSGVKVDDITIDATTLALSSGNLTVDVAGKILLSADDAGTVQFYDGDLHYANISENGGNLVLQSVIQDEDIIFKGNDNGTVITALRLDFSAGGAAEFNGQVVSNAGFKVDDITIDATTLALSSGDLTLDVAGKILLSGDSLGEVRFLDGSLHYGTILENNSNMIIRSAIQDEDIIFQGNDAGTVITALTLDMSRAGKATFNAGINAQAITAESVLTANGGVIFNEGGGNVDFRVESTGNDSMLLVDADKNIVNINSSQTTAQFGMKKPTNGNVITWVQSLCICAFQDIVGANTFSRTRKILVPLEDLQSVTVTIVNSGHFYNDGSLQYSRETKITYMIEGSNERIYEQVDVNLLGTEQGKIGDLSAGVDSSGVMKITYDVSGEYTNFTYLKVEGTGVSGTSPSISTV